MKDYVERVLNDLKRAELERKNKEKYNYEIGKNLLLKVDKQTDSSYGKTIIHKSQNDVYKRGDA